MLPRRLRRTGIGGDPAWVADNIDPNTATGTLGGATANGIYAIDVVPEAEGAATISVEFDRQDSEDDAEIGTELASRCTALIGTTLGPYLREVSSAAGVVAIRARPNGLLYTLALRAPGGATFALDVDDIWPITDIADGKGELFIEFVATDAGEPLGAGSATVDVRIISVVDRRRPGSRVTAPDAAMSVTATEETATHPLGEPLIVKTPPGFFTVSITGSDSLPSGTDNLEIWCGLTGV